MCSKVQYEVVPFCFSMSSTMIIWEKGSKWLVLCIVKWYVSKLMIYSRVYPWRCENLIFMVLCIVQYNRYLKGFNLLLGIYKLFKKVKQLCSSESLAF